MDIGIDLGTTFSVVAVDGKVELAEGYPSGIYLAECDVTIIPTPYGEQTFPSVMIEDPDHPHTYLFGSDALRKAEDGYPPVMFSKRRMGTKEPIPLETQVVVAKDVAREFLRYLKFCAEQALGRPVVRAVVTHPAYFDRGAVEETRAAAQEAGFEMSQPEQMLMEPVAAALAYTRTDKREPLRILTYDLGGGTFDVTYLERTHGVIDMRAFDGDHLLGGYNFDRELVHWVRKRLELKGRRIVLDEGQPADRGRLARLLRLAEKVKIALSEARTDTALVDFRARDILVDVDGKPMQINERISRQEFVGRIQPYLDRILECCRRALAKADVEMSAVDEVLLVGGSTYGPWIVESLQRAFSNTKPRLFSPDLCVGAGAAIHAKMALPVLVQGEDYRLLLDVPESSVLDVLNVAGQVARASGEPVIESLSVRLRLPTGTSLGPCPLSAQGRFLFEAVELRDDGPNPFTLTVQDARQTIVLERGFSIAFAPQDTETSTVTTVLPKPLYIMTLDGLVPLAQEGVALPAKRSQTFKRDNDKPHITIELYQDRDPIGEVRIENIPPEGGKGSFVDLEVEVTEKNQIRGQATIRTPDGRIVTRSKVSICFTVPDVLPVDDLQVQWGELQERFQEQVAQGRLPDNARLAKASEMLAMVGNLFEQQPLERQEIQVALRQLRDLLEPPADDMKPTREQFLKVVQQCREAVHEMELKAQAVLEQVRRGEIADRAFVANAEKGITRAGQYRQLIDKLEREGLIAHQRRDRKQWARAHDAITDIELQVRRRPKVDSMPTFLHKLLASFEVRRTMGRLAEQAEKIERQGKARDWHGEFANLQRGLVKVLEDLQAINDDLPTEQGRAMIRKLFDVSLRPLNRAVERLGVDVSKVK